MPGSGFGFGIDHARNHSYGDIATSPANQHTGTGDVIPIAFVPTFYGPLGGPTLGDHLAAIDAAIGGGASTLQQAYDNGNTVSLTVASGGPISLTNSDQTSGNSILDLDFGAVTLTGNMPGVLIDSSGLGAGSEAFGHVHIRLVHSNVTYAAAVTGFSRGVHVDGSAVTITANNGASGFESTGLRVDMPDLVEVGTGSANLHGLQIIGNSAPLRSALNGEYAALNLQMARASDLALHVTNGSVLMEGGGVITITDAAVPTSFLFTIEDFSNVAFFNVDATTFSYGPTGNRGFEFGIDSTGRDGIRFLPDGRTVTTAPVTTYMLQWDSTVISNIPGGGGIGNDTAPAMIGATGTAQFNDAGNLFSSMLLFNQGTQVRLNGVSIGPLYTMVNQPNVRSLVAGSYTVSQANAVRSQMSLGPNTAGNLTLTSHEAFFATITVDATVGTVTATTVNYFAPKAPTLTAGGTIGTLNVLDIPNIPAAGITTLRGINSAMASGTFINHTGAATSVHVGDVRIGATGAPSNELSVSGNMDITGELYIGATAPVGVEVLRVVGASLLGGDVEIDGDLNHDGTLVGFYGAAPVAQAADPGALTDNTGGTADNTVAAVAGSGADATINDNFADLIDQINQLRAMLSAAAGGVGISA